MTPKQGYPGGGGGARGVPWWAGLGGAGFPTSKRNALREGPTIQVLVNF